MPRYSAGLANRPDRHRVISRRHLDSSSPEPNQRKKHHPRLIPSSLHIVPHSLPSLPFQPHYQTTFRRLERASRKKINKRTQKCFGQDSFPILKLIQSTTKYPLSKQNNAELFIFDCLFCFVCYYFFLPKEDPWWHAELDIFDFEGIARHSLPIGSFLNIVELSAPSKCDTDFLSLTCLNLYFVPSSDLINQNDVRF